MQPGRHQSPAFAVVHDIAASWEDYMAGRPALDAGGVPGLILHAAGPTDEGVRTIDVWESQDAWMRRRAGWLGSVLDELPRPPAVRELSVRDLLPRPAI